MTKTNKTVFILQDDRLGDSVIFDTYESMIKAAQSVLNDMYMYENEMTDEEKENDKSDTIKTLDYKEVLESEIDESDYTYDYRLK